MSLQVKQGTCRLVNTMRSSAISFHNFNFFLHYIVLCFFFFFLAFFSFLSSFSLFPLPFRSLLAAMLSGLKLEESQMKGRSVSVTDVLYKKGCIKNVQEGMKVRY